MKTDKNRQLIEQFLNTLDGEDKSQNTITNYRVDLNMLIEYLNKKQTDIDEVDLQTLESFRTHLKHTTYGNGKHYSANTRARRITSVRVFYHYLYTRDIIKNNPAENLIIPQATVGVKPDFMTEEDAIKVIKATEGETHEQRDRLIIKLFLITGMRVSELAGLDIEDIDELKITIRKGKGNKAREIFITDDVKLEIDSYLKDRTDNRPFLFISQKNNRLSVPAIQSMVKKYIVKAGLDPKKFSTHSLRHSFTSTMLIKGADIVSLQQALGHSSLETTQKYAHVTDETRQSTANLMQGAFN